MNKLLLGTAVLAISLPLASVDAASKSELTPSLRFSGETSVNYYGFKQSVREGNGGKGNGHHMEVADSRLNVDIFGKTEYFGGIEYSALLGLSGNPDNGNVQENRLKFKNEWGTLIAGDTRGVDDFMAVGAFAVMGATGGFAGNYTSVLNQTTGTVITTDLAGAPKDSTKVIYVTPRISGVQAGITFTPSTGHEGDQKLKTVSPSVAKSLPFDKNQVGLGINFKETFTNGLDVRLSATSLFGKTQAPTRLKVAENTVPATFKNTQSYALGAQFGYHDWVIGGEFIDNGKSQVGRQDFSTGLSRPATGGNAGKVYSVALGYTFGKHKVAVGYLESTRNLQSGFSSKAKAKVYSATWDRKIAPGLGIYAGINHADMKTASEAVAAQNALKSNASDLGLSASDIADGVGNNRATTVEGGVKLKF